MDALPAQVRAQAEAADRLLAGTPAEAPQQPPPQPADVPAVTTEQQPAAPAAQTEQPKADDAAWEQRYRTLQGMFNAQKQRDEDARKALEAQLRDALTRLQSLEQAAPKPAEKQPAASPVTDKDVEAFGSDMIDFARRVAQEQIQAQMAEVQKIVAAKDAEIADLRKQLGGVEQRTQAVTQVTYLGELTKVVPDWREINGSQPWLEWLSQTDPMTGVQRQAYLDDAFRSQDVNRTAAIFAAFKGMTQPAPAPQAPPAQAELQRQVQPASSQAAPASPATQAGRIFSAGEIGKFYDDLARGAYRGKEKEAARISAEIDAALEAGRVKP